MMDFTIRDMLKAAWVFYENFSLVLPPILIFFWIFS
jgi:hypothetical protein